MTIRVDPDSRYSTREQRLAYFDEVLRRVKEIPGVEAAGITDALPLGRNRTWGAGAKGVDLPARPGPVCVVRESSATAIRGDGHSAVAGRDIAERHGAERTRHRRQRDDGA